MAFAGISRAEDVTIEERVLKAGDRIEKNVESAAEFIDITLAGRKYIKKENPSYINLSQLFTYSEGGRFRPSTDFLFNLRLPNVEKRWQLRFTSYDEEQESRDLSQKRVRTRPREREFNAGLLFFERLGRVKTSFLPRLQLKDPLDVSYLLRFETEGKWRWAQVFPRVDLFADPKKGTGEFAQLEFRFALTDRLELALQNTEEYRDRENFFLTQNGMNLDYSLNDHQAVGGGVTFASHNKPSFHLDSFTISTVFAQVIYTKRLSAALTPFIVFAKSARFKGSTGITLSFDLQF